MPKIDSLTIDRVKEAASIVDVIGDFVTLRKAGVNRTGLCPFHDDRNDGNFIVRPKGLKNGGNTYRCFVCGARGDSVKFLMEHERLSFPDAIRWLGKKFDILVDDVPFNYVPPPPKPLPPPPPVMEIPREWVSGMMQRRYPNNFITWLYRLPWSDEGRKQLSMTLWQYCVAGFKDGRVCFWQIDHTGIPRSAKLMRYLDDGHRVKTEHPGWLYNQQGIRERLDPDNHTILRPLFGSHLLKAYPNAVVNIVESEKTAIIMANYYGEPDRQLWLACGGLSWLKLEAMQPLIDQQRTVWLWPDRDGVDEWQKVCDKLGSDNIRVYTEFFRTCYVPEDDGPKADIADIAIRLMSGGRLPDPSPSPSSSPVVGGSADDNISETEQWAILNDGEPFLDPEELRDPRLHDWRQKLRMAHRPKPFPTVPTSQIPGVMTVGEILLRHPILKPLIDRNNEERRKA